MVVDGTIMEASNPKYWAIVDWNLLAVGSSSNTSSPTSAVDIAQSISSGGTLITSLLKSMQSLGFLPNFCPYIRLIDKQYQMQFYQNVGQILGELILLIQATYYNFYNFPNPQKMNSNDQILKYLNLARQYPGYFLPLLQKQINSFVNQKEMPLSEGVLYETNEGRSVWIETRNFLMNQKSLPPLAQHQGLSKSAFDHKNDLCQNGIFGHRGSDGSSFSERILKHCKKGPGAMAEIIGADFDLKDRNTAQMTILSLIIDDGVKDRGHRKTIFSPTYRYVGWSSGKQEQKYITVINLTENNLQPYPPVYNNENSFCGVVPQQAKSPSKQSGNPTRHHSMGWDRPIKDISNNLASTTPEWKMSANDFGFSKGSHMMNAGSTINDGSKLGARKGKKMTQKRENTRTFFEDGAKILETTIKLIYNDGSVEESTERRTLYIDQ